MFLIDPLRNNPGATTSQACMSNILILVVDIKLVYLSYYIFWVERGCYGY